MAKILAVGGGSGGHVTPVVAVFKELRDLDPSITLEFWCDRKFGPTAKGIVADFDARLPVRFISAGKFRRYHGASRWQYLQPSIFWPNFIDLFRVAGGFWQSFIRMVAYRPDVVFTKGGYVCLPVGLAARMLRIPIVIHDSDAHPGLTNRLLAPFASRIATGAPLEYYSYPPSKTKYVGIPVAQEFRRYSTEEQRGLKASLGFDQNRPLLVVTGGGLGASRLNQSVVGSLDRLLDHMSVLLITGRGQYDEIRGQLGSRDGMRLEAFISAGMAEVLAAADVVVTRAGATTLVELAALARPTIIVPNALLTAGHQLKNAKVYQDSFAAIVMKEDELTVSDEALADKVIGLLSAPRMLEGLSDNFVQFAKPHAAKQVAEMILEPIGDSRAQKR